MAVGLTTVQPGRRGDDEEEEDDLLTDSATLSAMEMRINADPAFHGFKNLDTKISACQVCKRRLLQFAAPSHYNEVHRTHAGEEASE